LNILKSLFRPNNLVFLSLVSPVTEPLVGEVAKLWISVLKCLDNLAEIWLPNLPFDCSVNHWPECWRFTVNVMALSRITF